MVEWTTTFLVSTKSYDHTTSNARYLGEPVGEAASLQTGDVGHG